LFVSHQLRFLWRGLLLLGIIQAAPVRLCAQIRKTCEDGVSLKLSAASTPQGSLVLADITNAKPLPDFKAAWDGKPTPLWTEGQTKKTLHALLGVDLEKAPGKYDWKVSWNTAQGQAITCAASVTVLKGKFRTESLKVDNQFVQPDPEQQKRAEDDQKKMKAIYDTVTPERLWEGKFRLPLNGVTTGGNFGRRRVLNGQPRSPHAGVDFPAAVGTPVFAAQSGKVVLAEELYYSGNTVVIDHGYGIYTLYAHLSEIAVKPGQVVAMSNEIGKVGATGRVTGPHLHWGLTVEHARVNGMDIVERRP
jgi:murein DD-endopeptidase MepM/ murein hydrolase activator NlpD